MWTQRPSRDLQPSAYSRRSTAYIDREFQLRYARYFVSFAALGTVLFFLPILIFANENYGIFFRLADLLSPQMANYIHKEHITLNVVLVAAMIAHVLFWYMLAHRATAKIAGPAKLLRNHIRIISRGDLSLPPLRVRDDDEFRELIHAYNYFYTLIKVQHQREIEDLQKVRGATTNPMAREILDNMIERKSQQLVADVKITNPATSLDAAAIHGSPRAS